MINLFDIVEGILELIGNALKRFDQKMEQAYPELRRRYRETKKKRMPEETSEHRNKKHVGRILGNVLLTGFGLLFLSYVIWVLCHL